MKILINGKVYDSTETPVLLVFDENEQKIFNLKRFVSAPSESTLEERHVLMDTEI